MLPLLLLAALSADVAPERQRAPKPSAVALVFSAGYAGDHLPKDDARFEKLLIAIKAGGFNTVHTTYTKARVALCKKHGVKLMVDLLAPEHHVYNSPEKCKTVCEALKGEAAVWGYNIWNDPVRKTSPGRQRDILNVRKWDPTHPAYSGTYRTDGMGSITAADVIGYYDFHWKRGLGQHLPHTARFLGWAREREAWWGCWLSATSGIAGKGNFNRSLYSANTALASGCKVILWFLATDLMDLDRLEWKEAGKDILKVHAEIAPLCAEMARLGLPKAVYSTPATKTANNEAIPAAALPGGTTAFPKGLWLTVSAGEVLVGDYAGEKPGVVFVANHNAYAGQAVELRVKDGTKAELFGRKESKWLPLEAKGGVVKFRLAPAGGELVRFGE